MWTTFDDVSSRWVGSTFPGDEMLVNALISDAEEIISAEFPRIQERINNESLSINTVKLVVSRMVSRLLRNPEGLSSYQQTTGPFSIGRNYGSSSTDVWLSNEERALLSPSNSGKAFSVDLAPNMVAPTETTEIWIDA